MKTRKMAVLPAMFLISLIFSGCTTIYSFLYGSTRWYGYDFANNNKFVTEKDGNAYSVVVVENTQLYFSFSFYTKGYLYKRRDIRGGRYSLEMKLFSESNLIKNVSFSKIMICTEADEYDMVERIDSLLLLTNRGHIILEGENSAAIRSTGRIDFTAYTLEDENYTRLQDSSMRTSERGVIFIGFQSIPIDVIRYEGIKVCFDISVELTTGEIITLNEEFIGLRKVERVPNRDSFWFPTT